MAYVKKPKYYACDGKMYQVKNGSRGTYWSPQMEDDLKRMFPTTINEEMAGYLGVSVRTMLRKARELGVKKDPDWLREVWDERRRWAHMASRLKGYPGGFQKGCRANPAGEFKLGHQESEEEKEKRRQSMKRWYRTHPREVKAKAAKAWETRRRRMESRGNTTVCQAPATGENKIDNQITETS